MRPATRWLALLVAVMLAPVALAVVDGTGAPRTLWSDLAVITGGQAVAAAVLTLAAVARIRAVTGTLGIDGAMGAHRVLGSATASLAAVHLVAVIGDNPSSVWLLDPTVAPRRAVAATAALVVFAGLVGTARRRQRRYEWWRWAHRAGAATALGLVALHIWWLNRLVNVWPWLALFVSAAGATLGLCAWRWLARARHGRYLVVDMRAETSTVSTVRLVACGEPLTFEAGQFAWLRLRPSPWAEDHPFTLSSPAGAETLDVTFRHAGDWTTGPLQALRPGTPVWLDGPHGAMTLAAAQDAPGIVMVAAGVGLTPALSMLRTLAERGDRRPVVLLIPPGETLFRDELTQLAQVLDLTVTPSLARPVTAQTVAAALPDRAWPGQAVWFVCGPPGMVADTAAALTELHIPPERVRTEQFEIV